MWLVPSITQPSSYPKNPSGLREYSLSFRQHKLLNKQQKKWSKHHLKAQDLSTSHFPSEKNPTQIKIDYFYLCKSLDLKSSWQVSSSLVISGPLYKILSMEQASTERPRARSTRNGKPPDTSSEDSCSRNREKFSQAIHQEVLSNRFKIGYFIYNLLNVRYSSIPILTLTQKMFNN